MSNDFPEGPIENVEELRELATLQQLHSVASEIVSRAEELVEHLKTPPA